MRHIIARFAHRRITARLRALSSTTDHISQRDRLEHLAPRAPRDDGSDLASRRSLASPGAFPVKRTNRHAASQGRLLNPPPPPLELTPLLACDAATDVEILWHIARHAPNLRRWLIANPRADAALLEYVAQVSGPGVVEGLAVLFESMESDG